jgi:hypothetical protein
VVFSPSLQGCLGPRAGGAAGAAWASFEGIFWLKGAFVGDAVCVAGIQAAAGRGPLRVFARASAGRIVGDVHVVFSGIAELRGPLGLDADEHGACHLMALEGAGPGGIVHLATLDAEGRLERRSWPTSAAGSEAFAILGGMAYYGFEDLVHVASLQAPHAERRVDVTFGEALAARGRNAVSAVPSPRLWIGTAEGPRCVLLGSPLWPVQGFVRHAKGFVTAGYDSGRARPFQLAVLAETGDLVALVQPEAIQRRFTPAAPWMMPIPPLLAGAWNATHVAVAAPYGAPVSDGVWVALLNAGRGAIQTEGLLAPEDFPGLAGFREAASQAAADPWLLVLPLALRHEEADGRLVVLLGGPQPMDDPVPRLRAWSPPA